MTPELALAEHQEGRPFSFPREPRPVPPPDMVRVPSIAEIGVMLEWAFPLIQRQFPKAMKMPLAQLLRQAAVGAGQPPMRVLHSKNALGFAVTERDCLTGPQGVARVRMVVCRDDALNEAVAVRAALHDWARTTVGTISVVDDDVTATAASEQPAAEVKASAKPGAKKQAKRRNARASRRSAAAHQSLADQSQEDPERQALSSVA